MLRSIEVARRYDVPLLVRSSFTDAPGTLIGQEDHRHGTSHRLRCDLRPRRRQSHHPRPARRSRRWRPRSSPRWRKANVNVDLIIQNVSAGGTADISFTAAEDDLAKIDDVLERLQGRTGLHVLRHRPRRGQGHARGRRHEDLPGRRRQDVRGAGRERHQHRDDLHQLHQDQLRHPQGARARRRSRPCTRPSRWTRSWSAARRSSARRIDAAGRPQARRKPRPSSGTSTSGTDDTWLSESKACASSSTRPRARWPSTASPSPSKRARSSACSAPTAPARPPPSRSSPACSSPTPATPTWAVSPCSRKPDEGQEAHRRRPAGHRPLRGPERAGEPLFWGRMYGMNGTALNKRVDEVLELIGLVDRQKDRVDKYSGGMKRRVNIGAALLAQAAPPLPRRAHRGHRPAEPARHPRRGQGPERRAA